ncbi:MAG: hypothetical protein HYX63_14060 [Gammaproteobacteria bacterium]|nr:hypothetical protein [Gammaproteobacteria bacterium]
MARQITLYVVLPEDLAWRGAALAKTLGLEGIKSVDRGNNRPEQEGQIRPQQSQTSLPLARAVVRDYHQIVM